jgi:hypothetical protein
VLDARQLAWQWVALMLRVVLLIGLFVLLLWLAAMSSELQVLLMFAGIIAVCWTIDHLGQRER